MVVALTLGVGLVAAAVPASAQDERFQVKLAPTYEQGDFGLSEITRTYFVPLTLKYLHPRFDIAATVSYVRLDGPGGVTFVEGTPTATAQVVQRPRQTDEGFGDILLKGRFFLFEDPGPSSPLPTLTPFLKLKIPTAQGNLGTGEPDYGFGLELDKTFGPVIIFGDVSYTVIGEPAGQDFRNRPAASLGAGWRLSSLATIVGYVEWRRAIVAGQEDPVELLGGVVFRLTRTLNLTPYVYVGLTSGSPDVGVGVEVSYKFGRF
jgi:outer membrane putative beta-barrel porin/alpha-amylase